MKSQSDWAHLSAEYMALLSADLHLPAWEPDKAKSLAGKVAAQLPRDTPSKLQWFIEALTRDSDKWFVAAVMSKANPMPRTLFEPLVLAALLESNVSSNRWLVEPCIRSFGVEAVTEKMLALASHPRVVENDGVNKLRYWIRELKE